MTNYKLKSSILVCFTFFWVQIFAQTISVNDPVLSDYLRRQQLDINTDNTTSSFSVHHFSNSMLGDSLSHKIVPKKHNAILSSLTWLPFSLSQQVNTHHPFGWNDAAMIPAAGYQAYVSAGLFANFGHLSIQIQPELVYAQNKEFETFKIENYDPTWANYYQWLNRSDIPERFGDQTYKKLLAGQSSIRFNLNNVSIGVSTENMWWGPGRRNALVMSNNAAGFLHATINSIKPIQTKIGSFEGQIIAGKLTNSGIIPPESYRLYNGANIYQPKNDETRFISGMVLSWQPKWVKGLFLGFAKTSYLYQSDISGIADILPLEGLIVSDAEKKNKKASLGSVFLRYVLFEDQAEIYGEYGRSDRSASMINLLTDKDYPRGYVIGMRKLSDKRANGSQVEVALELTQLELPNATLINNVQSWYLHDYVRQGYTNQGKVLGAGIGPGSNSQMLDISWVKGYSKVGLMLERIVHNNDFYYYAFANPPDVTRHWIDLAATFHADWKYKRFLFSSEMGLIRSLNYEWWVIPKSPYFENGYDFLNLHGKISFSYRL